MDAAVASIDAAVEAYLEATGVPGCAVAVTDRGRTLHVGLHGLADRAAGRPPTPATLWQIGSISKSFAALVVLGLAAEGRLDLDAPVVRYVPWFGGRADVSLHHLLCHTAGIPMGSEYCPDSRFEVASLGERGVHGTPGGRAHYSNVGYRALGFVVEAVCGEPYPDVVTRRVLRPAGMASAVAAVRCTDRLAMAVGHMPLHDDAPPGGSNPHVAAPWFETAAADQAIVATPEDLAAYARLLLARGAPVLAPEAFARFGGRHSWVDEDGWYGYGIEVSPGDAGPVLHHAGGMVGLTAQLVADVGRGLGAVAFLNGNADAGPLARHALAAVAAARDGTPLPTPGPPAPYLAIPPPEPAPPGLEPLLGRYGAWTPVSRSLRVLLRRGRPTIRHEEGLEEPLHEQADGSFAVGEDGSPERLRFDTVVEGRAQRADLSGCAYYRSLR